MWVGIYEYLFCGAVVDQIFKNSPYIPSFKTSGVQFAIGIRTGTSFSKAIIGVFIYYVVPIDSLQVPSTVLDIFPLSRTMGL